MEIQKLDGQNINWLAVFAEMEKTIQKNGEFPETLYNVGFYAHLAANEVIDSQKAKDLYLQSAEYYLQFLKKFPGDLNAYYGIALAYWHASQHTDEPENRELGDQAYSFFKKCISRDNENETHSWNFSSFLEYYAGLMETFQEGVILLTEAITVLDPLIKADPENAALLFKRGTKNMFAGHYSENSNEKEAFFIAAETDFELSLNLVPHDVKCMNNLGYCMIQLGKLYNDHRSKQLLINGIKLMEEIIMIEPNKIDSYQNKTMAFIALFQLESNEKFLKNAELSLIKANELHPGSANHFREEIDRLIAK